MNIKGKKWQLTTVRLPIDVKSFLEREAVENCSTQTAEVVRAVRAAMKEKGVTEVAASSRHVEQSQLTNGDRYDR